MPDIEQSDLHQKAVYWAATSTYDNYGEQEISAAVEIDVRWEYKRQEVVDSQGNVRAVLATVVVDREVDVGGVMWLGTLADYTALATDPVRYYIFSYKATPDVKNRATRKVVELVKLGTELPDIA